MSFARSSSIAVLIFAMVSGGSVGAEETSNPEPRIAELEVLVRELLDRIEVMNSRIKALERSESELTLRVRRFEMGIPEPEEPESEPDRVAEADRPDPRRLGELYQAAVVLQANGRYEEAIVALTEVFESDTNGELADNALFWIGETHFARREYQLAVKFYERIAVDYADENKAPDALLGAARSYGKMGDLIQARKVIDRLIMEYPYSPAAESARAERDSYRY